MWVKFVSTHNCVNRNKMDKTAYIVNLSRGSIWYEDQVITAPHAKTTPHDEQFCHVRQDCLSCEAILGSTWKFLLHGQWLQCPQQIWCMTHIPPHVFVHPRPAPNMRTHKYRNPLLRCFFCITILSSSSTRLTHYPIIARLRGSHCLSTRRVRRTKSSRPKGPPTRSWGPMSPLTFSFKYIWTWQLWYFRSECNGYVRMMWLEVIGVINMCLLKLEHSGICDVPAWLAALENGLFTMDQQATNFHPRHRPRQQNIIDTFSLKNCFASLFKCWQTVYFLRNSAFLFKGWIALSSVVRCSLFVRPA